METVTAATASTAARWAVNMEPGNERRRLIDGHRRRRVETMRDSYRHTDHTAADAWLIGEYLAARATAEGK
jgi:hypothetical protein